LRAELPRCHTNAPRGHGGHKRFVKLLADVWMRRGNKTGAPPFAAIGIERELADGRIYSGKQALANGLVDELGNLDDAIAKAADLGGISGEPRLVEFEHLPTFSQMLTGVSGRMNQSEADKVFELISEFTTPTLEYRYVGPQ